MKKISQWIKIIIELLAMVLAMVVTFQYLLLPIKVEGSSMYPTLSDQDIALVSMINLNKKNIKRFDVVVLNCEVLDKKIIKRVIGLPGETIVYKNDKLYINGEFYEENYLNKKYVKQAKKESHAEQFTNDFSITLKDNEFFVLGDNRLHSADSRTLGTFHFKDILGKRGLVLYPFNHMKWMD